MKVVVTGSRDWKDWPTLKGVMDRLWRGMSAEQRKTFVVVHGSSTAGLDVMVKKWVEHRSVEPLRRTWASGYGKVASEPGATLYMVFCFGGLHADLASVIDKALGQNVPVRLYPGVKRLRAENQVSLF